MAWRITRAAASGDYDQYAFDGIGHLHRPGSGGGFRLWARRQRRGDGLTVSMIVPRARTGQRWGWRTVWYAAILRRHARCRLGEEVVDGSALSALDILSLDMLLPVCAPGQQSNLPTPAGMAGFSRPSEISCCTLILNAKRSAVQPGAQRPGTAGWSRKRWNPAVSHPEPSVSITMASCPARPWSQRGAAVPMARAAVA